jgi:hypothetical protein
MAFLTQVSFLRNVFLHRPDKSRAARVSCTMLSFGGSPFVRAGSGVITSVAPCRTEGGEGA